VALVAGGVGGYGGQTGMEIPSSTIATFTSETATGVGVTMAVIAPATLPTVLVTQLTGPGIQAIVPDTPGTFVLPPLLRDLGHPIRRLAFP
jgi:hypothetical protein